MTTSEPSYLVQRGFDRMEEYKAILEDTAGISGRRQTTNDVFVGLNVVFLTGIGFLLSTTHFTSWVPVIAVVMTAVAVSGLNGIWIRLLKNYSSLLRVRHDYLIDVEAKFRKESNDDTVGMFLLLRKTLYRDGSRFGFAYLERRMAVYLTGLDLLVAGAAAALTYLVTNNYIPPVNL